MNEKHLQRQIDILNQKVEVLMNYIGDNNSLVRYHFKEIEKQYERTGRTEK